MNFEEIQKGILPVSDEFAHFFGHPRKEGADEIFAEKLALLEKGLEVRNELFRPHFHFFGGTLVRNFIEVGAVPAKVKQFLAV